MGYILAISGLFSVLFGLVLLRRPLTGVEVLILITAFYLLSAGVMQLILGFKVRGWANKIEDRVNAAAAA